MIRTVFNQKGGVGKSTIVCNLAAAAANTGRRAVVVDLDPQGNSTSYLGHDGQYGVVGMTEFFESQLSHNYRRLSADDFVRETAFTGLFLVAANRDMADLEQKLTARHKILKLRKFASSLAAIYDDVILDTPPAFDFFSLSALIAADSVLIPFDCDEFSRDALFELLQNIDEVREDYNSSLLFEGVVINQFQSRANYPRHAVAELREAGVPVREPYISMSVKVRESHSAKKPLVLMEPRHKVSQEFVSLYSTLSMDGGQLLHSVA
jgi:chromosome partitioning protein